MHGRRAKVGILHLESNKQSVFRLAVKIEKNAPMSQCSVVWFLERFMLFKYTSILQLSAMVSRMVQNLTILEIFSYFSASFPRCAHLGFSSTFTIKRAGGIEICSNHLGFYPPVGPKGQEVQKYALNSQGVYSICYFWSKTSPSNVFLKSSNFKGSHRRDQV